MAIWSVRWSIKKPVKVDLSKIRSTFLNNRILPLKLPKETPKINPYDLLSFIEVDYGTWWIDGDVHKPAIELAESQPNAHRAMEFASKFFEV